MQESCWYFLFVECSESCLGPSILLPDYQMLNGHGTGILDSTRAMKNSYIVENL